MKRRTMLGALGSAAVVGFTGCLSGDETASPDSASPSETDSPSPSETDSPSPSEADNLVVSGPGDYPHSIRIDNSLEHEVTLTITVAREDAQLYQESHTVTERSDVVVAGITEESLPEDSRPVSITARDSSGNDTSVNVSVSDCLGNIVFYFEASGTVESTYSIC